MAARKRRRRSRRQKPSFRQRLADIREDPRRLLDDPRRLTFQVLSVLAVLAVLLFSWQAFRAYGAIQDAEVRAGILQQNIVEGDVPEARRSFALLNESTSRAHGSTDGPLWWLGAQVPVLGKNVDAVRTVSREIDQVVDEVLPGVVDVADKVRLETYRPKDGRIDLAAVADAAPVMVTADRVLTEANRDVGAIDPEELIGPLQSRMTRLQDRFASTATAASAADDAARLLPRMVGGDGSKRNYLLMTMNNAEIRSLGGMPGSYAVITARDGKLKMGRQGGILKLRPLAKPPAGSGLTEDELRVLQSNVATDMRNTAIHPDFPRAAELAAAIAGKRWKKSFDGVIAVDPVTLSYMLNGLGPIDVGSGFTINANNAVAVLLNQVYLKYPIQVLKHDEVFENSARRIFDATVAGTGDSIAVIRALVRGVSERRLMLWSRDAAEQERLKTSGISGRLDDGRGRPQVGVYVNANAGYKMDFYLGMGSKLRSEACLDDSAQELRMTTTLVSNAPANARQLPPSIVGLGRFGSVPGNLSLGVMIFGPRGGEITSMTIDGEPAPVGAADLNGQPVAKLARVLGPGQNSVIVTTMRTRAGSPGDPELRTTPGVLPNEDSAGPSACGD